MKSFYYLPRPILTPVIYHDDFIVELMLQHYAVNPLCQMGQRFVLVEQWYND